MISSIKLSDEEMRSQIFKEILCHIPDEVLQNYLNLQSSCDKDDRIIMFIDVSGFTAMTERFSKHSRAGIDELTFQLNKYFAIIVDHILAANGDVLKFAGDAILASWLGYSNSTNVLECAISIHQSCNHYIVTSPTLSEVVDKHMELELNVRIVVSMGKSRYIHLTSEKLDHFIVIGEVIDQLKDIEKDSEISVVLVSKQFWSVLPMPAKLKINKSTISSCDKWIKILCKTDDKTGDRQAKNIRAQKDDNNYQRRFIFTLIIETHENLDRLFKLVIEPVVERIAHLEPLIYASEMTELSICFVNAHIEKGADLLRYQQVIALMFNNVSSISCNYDGLLSKVVGFDKGLSFLCLFGLGSSDNPYVCALDAALAIRSHLLEIDDLVIDISIGVTSGIMYCGVVGHPDRHEYTTIGRKVNMAARFMCAYPNIVSCDRETMLYSKLSEDNFTELEFKQLKGMESNVEAYEYGKQCMQSKFKLADKDLDLICNREIKFFGRRLELLTVCCKLIQYMGTNSSRNRGNSYKSYMLIFFGEDGSGRSTLIRHLFQALQKSPIDREVMFITCLPVRTLTFKVSEYAGLTKILAQLLKIKSFDNDVEYRRMLFRRLLRVHDVSIKLRQFLIDWFCLRNDIAMQTNTNDCPGPDDAIMIELIDLVFCYLQPKQFIVLIDDFHHMDDQSLLLVARLSRPPKSIIIGVARSSTKLSELVRLNDVGQYIEFKSIASIKEREMQDMICDIFKVHSIEKGLLKVIYQRTRGMPVLCVETLLELHRCSLVAIADLTPADKSGESPRINSTRKNVRSKVMSKHNLLVNIFFEKRAEESSSGELRHLYCLSGNPNSLDMPNTIESAFMREYNRLAAFEKSLLSNCSVLDLTFSKMYLYGICKGNLSANTFNTAIKTLFENHILTCAYNNKTYSMPQIKCFCPHNSTNLPFFCRMYKFWHDSVRSIVYSSMTRETVKYRRLNAINWLEKQLPKVVAAGNLFGGYSGLSVEAVKLPVSHTVDMIASKRSFINILGIMRIKSYEQMMTLPQITSNSQANFLTSDLASDIDHFKRNLSNQSKGKIISKLIFKGMLETHVIGITLKWIKFSDGVVKRADFSNTFERWRRIDITIRLDYHPFTACMLLNNVPLNELNEMSRKLLNLNSNKIENLLIDENVINLTKKQIHLGIYIPCRQQMVQIMEEIITHASIMADHERTLYYSLQLAIIHITANLALKAKSLLDNVDDLIKTHQIPMILISMFCLVKARFEQYITNNYSMAVQYFEDALKHIYMDSNNDCFHSLDLIRDSVVAMYMAQFIYIDLYRVTMLRRDIKEDYQDALLQTIANNLIYISKQLLADDIQTILVISEEYHTVQLLASIFRKAKILNLFEEQKKL